MKITVTELDARSTKKILKEQGFGLVECFDPYDSGLLFQARIWAKDDDGPSGGEVGVLNRDLGSTIARYTLEINDFRLPPARLAALLSALLSPALR